MVTYALNQTHTYYLTLSNFNKSPFFAMSACPLKFNKFVIANAGRDLVISGLITESFELSFHTVIAYTLSLSQTSCTFCIVHDNTR